MKQHIILLLIVLATSSYAQSRDEIIAGRAREFYRVMCQKDREVWKKFVTENYTKALQERQMQQKVSTPEGTTTSQDKTAAIEGKVKMLERLNQDFGSGKLVSVKALGEEAVSYT